MAATLTQPPPARALHGGPIWLRLSSNLVSMANSYLRISSTGPNAAGQQFTIGWLGQSITFTLAATPSSAVEWPVRTTETNQGYAGVLAEAICSNATVTGSFHVFPKEVAGVWYVYLEHKDRSDIGISFSEDIANLTAETFNSAGPYTEENLRALIEVYQHNDDPELIRSLGQQHAPYALDGTAYFDLSSHFAGMGPQPPPTVSIAGFGLQVEESLRQRYFVRYADQYGTPAVAEAMQRWEMGTVLFGSHSADALLDYATATVQHQATQRDGGVFWKPIGLQQPDWTYFTATASRSDYNYTVRVHWEDGTTAVFGGSPFSLTDGRMYHITTGALQLGVEAFADSNGKCALRYEFSLIDSADTHYFSRRYQIDHACQDWGHTLLYTNGVGGMDTVWLNGKATEEYETKAGTARRTRTPDWQPQQGDLLKYNISASPTWTASTGWYNNRNYLDHLRQLPMSAKAWIVDRANARFLPVLIQPGSFLIHEDDKELLALELAVQAAWSDKNANL